MQKLTHAGLQYILVFKQREEVRNAFGEVNRLMTGWVIVKDEDNGLGRS